MENIVVLKFGGSSLSDSDKIRHVADIALGRKRRGDRVIVVVSAMGKTTDSLLKDANYFSPESNLREMDMLLTSGERVSAALLSMAINASGGKAVSLTGSQAGIITDDNHTNARIIEIRPYRVLKALEEGNIVVVSGFQGVSFKKEVTTLGRGGSDISAVALASALGAKTCEIFSDVDGVYSADPRIVEHPDKIDILSYQEMQEMAEAGAKVLHPKAVEFAKSGDTEIHSKSTFNPESDGTIIKNLEGRVRPKVVGIASEERVTLIHAYDESVSGLAVVEKVIDFCHDKSVKVKQISFHRGHRKGMVGSFIIPEKENYHIGQLLEEMKMRFDHNVDIFTNYAAVSLIGTGITDRQDFLIKSIELLKSVGVTPGSFHTSSFRISILLERERLSQVVKLLYDEFI